MNSINYKREPKNDDSELHVCFRCSNEYSVYATVLIYSILFNNPNAYVYIYVVTDEISTERWENFKSISNQFANNEIVKVLPDPEDLDTLSKNSISYHGWGLIHISIYYQKYFKNLNKLFNFGVDTYCVGDLTSIWSESCDGFHYIGSSNRHQNKRSFFSLSPKWIGFDSSLLNLEAMRQDAITPELMAKYSIDKLGYIHDEFTHNFLCKRKFLNPNLYYIYSGSYLPKRTMNFDTRIVDFFNNLKPWDISVRGYEVFDRYIDYYNSVSKIIQIEFDLPKSFEEASDRLKSKGYAFLDWFPLRHRFIGQTVFRLSWGGIKLKRLANDFILGLSAGK